MKFLALLVSLVLAATSVKAAECTRESVASVESTPEYKTYLSACSAFTNLTGSEATTAAMKTLCGNATCLNAFEAVMKTVPDCTYEGASFKDTFGKMLTQFKSTCKEAGAASSASTAFTTTTVVAVAVVAAVVVQF